MTEALPVLAVLARWIHYLGIFLVVGGTVTLVAIVRPASRRGALRAEAAGLLRNRAARAGMVGGILVIVAGFVRGYLQVSNMIDPGDPVDSGLVRFLFTETSWGRGWTVQMLSGGLSILGHFLGTARLPGARFAPLLGAMALLLAAPLTGHATGSAEAGALGYPLDLLHLSGGATWIGTLLVLAVAGLWSSLGLTREERARTVATLIHLFSPVALVAGAVTLGAGLVLAARYVGFSFEAWTTSLYGQMLLVKLALVGAVAAAGAYNWRVIRPTLGDPTSTRMLRRSAAVELGLSAFLLIITAIVVSLPMPGDLP